MAHTCASRSSADIAAGMSACRAAGCGRCRVPTRKKTSTTPFARAQIIFSGQEISTGVGLGMHSAARGPRVGSMSLRVTSTVAKRLAEHANRAGDAPVRGWLVGPSDLKPGDLVVIGTLCRESGVVNDDYRRACSVLPGGLAVIGAYTSGDWQACNAYVSEMRFVLEGGFLLACIETSTNIQYFQKFGTSDTLVKLSESPEILPYNWLQREYALFRSEIAIPVGVTNSTGWRDALAKAKENANGLVFVIDVGDDDNDESVSIATAKKTTSKKSGKNGKSGKTGSSKANNPVIAKPSSKRVVVGTEGSSDTTVVGEFINLRDDEEDDHRVNSQVIFATPLTRASTVDSEKKNVAPCMTFVPEKVGGESENNVSRSMASFAHVDVLAYVSRGADFADVASALRLSLATQVDAIVFCLNELEASDGANSQTTPKPATWRLREPQCLHFHPAKFLAHYVTTVYLTPPEIGNRVVSNALDPNSGLEKTRVAYHVLLGLPTDRPMLRVANAMGDSSTTASTSTSTSGRLRNVHSISPGLPNSHVENGTTHCVKGAYDYYHYLQDRFDDNGWGCAYRSLQTICSWFRLQGYSTVAVPSHRDIQQCLTNIGDKDAEFPGSTQWIGALELSYFLDEKYGVQSKIMTVQSGFDLPQKGRELAKHFDEVGTPIMMGGGQLAYTLLGVEWCETSGECAFLILDPHYTGGEDVKTIVPRWCGWKKCEDVFVRQFYNLLMPQPPKGV